MTERDVIVERRHVRRPPPYVPLDYPTELPLPSSSTCTTRMKNAYAWWRLARIAKYRLLPPSPPTPTIPWISSFHRFRQRSNGDGSTALRTSSSAIAAADDAALVDLTGQGASRVIRASTIRQVHIILYTTHAHTHTYIYYILRFSLYTRYTISTLHLLLSHSSRIARPLYATQAPSKSDSINIQRPSLTFFIGPLSFHRLTLSFLHYF